MGGSGVCRYSARNLNFGNPSWRAGARKFALAGVAAVAAGLFSGGCAAVFEAPTAPSSTVGKAQAWHDAEALAARAKGRVVALGAGVSMAPLYGDHTIVVICPIKFADLKSGMTVVYRNDDGFSVAHLLTSREADGWRVMGLNNTRIDRALVTPRNLVGVVYAAFSYAADDADAR